MEAAGLVETWSDCMHGEHVFDDLCICCMYVLRLGGVNPLMAAAQVGAVGADVRARRSCVILSELRAMYSTILALGELEQQTGRCMESPSLCICA